MDACVNLRDKITGRSEGGRLQPPQESPDAFDLACPCGQASLVEDALALRVDILGPLLVLLLVIVPDHTGPCDSTVAENLRDVLATDARRSGNVIPERAAHRTGGDSGDVIPEALPREFVDGVELEPIAAEFVQSMKERRGGLAVQFAVDRRDVLALALRTTIGEGLLPHHLLDRGDRLLQHAGQELFDGVLLEPPEASGFSHHQVDVGAPHISFGELQGDAGHGRDAGCGHG